MRVRIVAFACVATLSLAACGPTAGNGPGDIEARAAAAGSPMPTQLPPPTHQGNAAEQPPTGEAPEPARPTSWYWDGNKSTYVATGTPPQCPSPLVEEGALVDVSKVTSKSQPGQLRDGEYLINGTYRWTSSDEKFPKRIEVRMPFDGYVTGAWQFTLGGAYLFGANIVHPCGLMIRLSKMRKPGPVFKAEVLDELPPAKEKDSRETFFSPGIWLPKGTVIAKSVGVAPPNAADLVGAFLDIAALDLRAPNPQIPPDFTGPQAAPQYLYYGHCFYQEDFLAPAEREFVAGLPISNGNPKSDTCIQGG